MDKLTEFGLRHEGCRAQLKDDGVRQLVPVCMGGTALVGCNNPKNCQKMYGEKINDPHSVHAIFLNDDKTMVTGINIVPREPLIPPNCENATE